MPENGNLVGATGTPTMDICVCLAFLVYLCALITFTVLGGCVFESSVSLLMVSPHGACGERRLSQVGQPAGGASLTRSCVRVCVCVCAAERASTVFRLEKRGGCE